MKTKKNFVMLFLSLALVLGLSVPVVMAGDVCFPCTNCSPLDLGAPNHTWGYCVVGDDYHMFWTNPAVMPYKIARPAIPADRTKGNYFHTNPGYYSQCPVLFNL